MKRHQVKYLDNCRDYCEIWNTHVHFGENSNNFGAFTFHLVPSSPQIFILFEYSVLFENTGVIESWEKTVNFAMRRYWSNTVTWACLQAAGMDGPSLGTACDVLLPSTFLFFHLRQLLGLIFFLPLKRTRDHMNNIFLAQSVYSSSLKELLVKRDH